MDRHAAKAIRIEQKDARYPQNCRERLGTDALPVLSAVGNTGLLTLPKTAIFCSSRCPGSIVLKTYDHAAQWRDEGRCVVSGFHSPIEKECLRILLRGSQPIIICPARAIDSMRIPAECRPAFEAGRLLYLSRFIERPVRVTKDLALPRNEMVAALADDAYVAYVSEGGQTEHVVKKLEQWGVPRIP